MVSSLPLALHRRPGNATVVVNSTYPFGDTATVSLRILSLPVGCSCGFTRHACPLPEKCTCCFLSDMAVLLRLTLFVQITVTAAKAAGTTLKIRIPAWATKALLDGKAVANIAVGETVILLHPLYL